MATILRRRAFPPGFGVGRILNNYNYNILLATESECRSFCAYVRQDIKERLTAVIGLELHAQINSKSKLFSGSYAEYGGSPNSQVSHFDAALPGTLPVLNKYCVKAAVKTALAFGCHVNKVSTFDRKHYFYADMPAGYQITQHSRPIAVGGEVEYVIYVRGRHKTASFHKARLHQIQLEQDSGKTLHDASNSRSLVDLNRAGVALMEIVTKPDFTTGEEAAAFVTEIQDTLLLLNTCNGKMEQGSLRVDANVSVHVPGEPLGIRTEVKNLNSVKAVQQAIDYEIKRQKELVSHGLTVTNETMSFDSIARCTIPMRDKERLQDYRFMAEPNLPPLVLSDGVSPSPHILSIDEIKTELPELRQVIRQRLMGYGLSPEHVVITMELGLNRTMDEMLSLIPLPAESVSKSVFLFLYQNVMMLSGARKISIEELLCQVSSTDLSMLWSAVNNEEITSPSAKQILNEHLDNPTLSVSHILNSGRFSRITDDDVILKLCISACQKHTKEVNRYKKKNKIKELAPLIQEIHLESEKRIHTPHLTSILLTYLKNWPYN